MQPHLKGFNLFQVFWDLSPWKQRTAAQDEAAFAIIQTLIRCFYAALLLFACSNFNTSIERYDAWVLDPLWPLFWMHALPTYRPGIHFVLLFFVFGSLLAAWRPDVKAFRIIAFLACLEGMALDNSFGKINNHLHLWTGVAFLFVFLPNLTRRLSRRTSNVVSESDTQLTASSSNSTSERATKDLSLKALAITQTVQLFWAAQAFVLLTYSMAGISKLLGLGLQLIRQDSHNFLSPESLARQVAERLLMTGEHSMLGEMVISHPYLSVPFYWGAIALETFAFAIAFFPRWHRLGALALILMHVGIFLTMNVTFANSILLLVILFFASPLTVGSKSEKPISVT